MKKINVLVCLGTRPEGIKLAPVIKLLEKQKNRFDYGVCSSGQHREMIAQVFDFFEYKPDYDLDLMADGQSLASFSSRVLDEIDGILEKAAPDIVLTQGDTTTAFLISLSAFYKRIKTGHVEAGLRTYDKFNPFPEEINRQLISRTADLHFAPTRRAYDNLIDEKIDKRSVFLAGNTIVDAINWGIEKIKKDSRIEQEFPFNRIEKDKKVILVTMHRRETFGKEMEDICHALKDISRTEKDCQIIYPVHLNPNVSVPVNKILGNTENVILTGPLDYRAFIWLMYKSYLIVTDSGGIQEEAPTLGKPVLVIRKKTERMESVECGISKLIGTGTKDLIYNVRQLISDEKEYRKMIPDSNPYGDGKASEKILDNIYDYFG
jgi:UDP-N-acetylglucosamine 2-epimerase (non-hydrolysing)